MGKEIKISATRINSFLRCKKKYWFNYVVKMPKVANPAFRLGIAVHEALEAAGKIWMKKQKFTKTDIKKILDVYRKVSIKEGIIEMEIHLKGLDLLKSRLSKFDFGTKVIGLETKFGFMGGPDVKSELGVPLIGAIDRVDIVNEDTLIITDYKTSATAPTPDQLRTDMQLSIYDVVARQLWPNYERVILSLDMLKSDVLYTYRTPEERVEFEAYLKEVHDQMKAFTEKDAKAELNMFCPWCDYKAHCPAYKKAYEKTDYKFDEIANLEDSQLVTEWKQLRNTKKILEERERELAMVIMEKIQDTGDPVHNEDSELYIRQNSRTTYDSETVGRLVPHDSFLKLANLNKKAVDNYLDANPAIKEEVLRASRVNYTSPFLAVKKVKKSKYEPEEEQD